MTMRYRKEPHKMQLSARVSVLSEAARLWCFIQDLTGLEVSGNCIKYFIQYVCEYLKMYGLDVEYFAAITHWIVM